MKKFFRSRDKEEKPKGPYAESISLSELEKMGKSPSQSKKEESEDPTLIFSDEFTRVSTNPNVKEYKPEQKGEKFESKDGKKYPYSYSKSTFPIQPMIVDKKLTIILIEDTAEVAKEKEVISKLLETHLNSDIVKIIYYGKELKSTKISYRYDFKNVTIQCTEKSGDKSCLYDALKHISDELQDSYMKEVGTDYRKERVNQVTIVGIGTCMDNCSKISKVEAIKSFSKVIKKPGIMSKYFCLTEKSFFEAAEIGFRSIGSIARNYQQ